MSTSLNWCLYILIAISAIISASCGEADRETAENRATANLGSAPNTQTPHTPSPPVNNPNRCRNDLSVLIAEIQRLQHEYALLRQSANKSSEVQNLIRELDAAEQRLKEQIQVCTAQPQLRSGKWVEQDGALVCDGYLTRSTDQDYCSALPPKDWVPYTFEGQQYYIQPLGSSESK